VNVLEIAPRLWRWTALHPEWTPEVEADDGWAQEVGCVYLEADDAVVLIDPLVPPEDAERFWRALDGDVERAALPVHVLLTIFWHVRSSGEIASRYPGTRIWAHRPAAELVGRRVAYTDLFDAGDPLPGGVRAIDARRAFEVLFRIPAHRALVAGDVLLPDGAGGVRVADEWLGPVDPHDLRAALRDELDVPIERVLVGHGPPVLANARAALDAALATPG